MASNIVVTILTIVAVAPAHAASSASEARYEGWVGFDEERQVDIYDSDGDSFPDLTEELAGTDPVDPRSNPSSPARAGSDQQDVAGFPAASCRVGFRQAGARLCISNTTQNAAAYTDATAACRDQMAHVCTYEDLAYVYLRSPYDATYNPLGQWIGNTVGDDQVFYGNRSVTFDNDPDIYNFEGIDDKSSSRSYWCCHDDEEGTDSGSTSTSTGASTTTSTGSGPPCCTGSCFARGTPIAMADGSVRSIESITEGSRVVSYDTSSNRIMTGEVTKTFVHAGSTALAIINGSLRATPNHPFHANGRWVHAEELQPGDQLVMLDQHVFGLQTAMVNTELRVESLVMLPTEETTYNLEVAEYHTYFAGGILVHNKEQCQICDF